MKLGHRSFAARKAAQVRQRHRRIGHEDPVVRRRGLVDEPDVTLDDLEPVDPELQARVLGLVGRLERLARGLFRRAGHRGSLDVVHVDPVHRGRPQLHRFERGRDFDFAVGRQGSFVHRQVVAISDRLEVVEGDGVELDLSHERRVGVGQEVSPSVRGHGAAVEHPRLQVHRRGINALLRVDVADVGGDEFQVVDAERLEGAVVLVRDVSPGNPQLVDLERIDRLERLLPSLVLDGSGVTDLGPGLRQVQDHDRVVDENVANHAPRQEGAPVDAGVKALDVGHRRVGILVLDDHGVAEVQGKVDRAEVELAYRHGIALEARVHLGFGIAAQRLVDEEERDPGGHDHEHDERARREEPAARGHARPPCGPSHGETHKESRVTSAGSTLVILMGNGDGGG